MPDVYINFIIKCLDCTIKYVKKISNVLIFVFNELYLFNKKIIITQTVKIVKLFKIPFNYTPVLNKERYDKLKAKEKINLDSNRNVQPGEELIKSRRKGKCKDDRSRFF
ncbi:hypothetical protein EXM63_02415 [Clostridium botulinum]|uniref:Uncharacterized protein n=1 Tax=Clostridium botulinum TaxID=1491 RepID=A0A6M0SX38_CLOBO|nr:hypothetical protein [Clostridium botulinum]NFI74355.1 hypothetical protein [Clostridium sporogenes]NFP62263.1 hypothetical protein [Clostridium sporogenes]NFU95585.1 hypothetical protein [Clostridium sporogenes]NFV67918.1 hypothetical protein [Clostridium botulinum]